MLEGISPGTSVFLPSLIQHDSQLIKSCSGAALRDHTWTESGYQTNFIMLSARSRKAVTFAVTTMTMTMMTIMTTMMMMTTMTMLR